MPRRALSWTVLWALLGVLVVALFGGWALWGFWAEPDPDRLLHAPQIRRDLETLEAAALKYVQAERRLPGKLDDLVPQFLAHVPRDPWGRAYVLRPGGPGRIYIWCLGSDGALKRYPPDICVIVNAPGL